MNGDDLMRQLLAAAFMCGGKIPALNNAHDPDPVQKFCSTTPNGWSLFGRARKLEYLQDGDGDGEYYVVTQKGKDFFYGDIQQPVSVPASGADDEA